MLITLGAFNCNGVRVFRFVVSYRGGQGLLKLFLAWETEAISLPSHIFQLRLIDAKQDQSGWGSDARISM